MDLVRNDKEGRAECEDAETFEIDVAAVHDVECSGLRHDLVEDVDVMHLAVGNADKRWDIAVKIKESVHLHGSLVLPESGPREQRQAQIDGRGIERVQALRQIDTDRIADVKRSCDPDQNLSEVGVDAPVMRFVGIAQSRPRHLAAQAHVVQLASQATEAGFDIAQTFTIRQLRERHRRQLVPTGKPSEATVAAIPRHALLKFFARQVINQLRKNGASDIHPPLFRFAQSPIRSLFQLCALLNFKTFPDSIAPSH